MAVGALIRITPGCHRGDEGVTAIAAALAGSPPRVRSRIAVLRIEVWRISGEDIEGTASQTITLNNNKRAT